MREAYASIGQSANVAEVRRQTMLHCDVNAHVLLHGFGSLTRQCVKDMRGTRQHYRHIKPEGGELSIDITGPFAEGLAPTDRPVAVSEEPKYILVAVYTPFAQETALRL